MKQTRLIDWLIDYSGLSDILVSISMKTQGNLSAFLHWDWPGAWIAWLQAKHNLDIYLKNVYGKKWKEKRKGFVVRQMGVTKVTRGRAQNLNVKQLCREMAEYSYSTFGCRQCWWSRDGQDVSWTKKSVSRISQEERDPSATNDMVEAWSAAIWDVVGDRCVLVAYWNSPILTPVPEETSQGINCCCTWEQLGVQ